MKSIFRIATAAAVAALTLAPAAFAQAPMSGSVMVGGAAMYPTKNIVENAVHSKDHTTLVAAVKAAGLVDTLSGPGPSRSSPRPTPPSPNCLPARSIPWSSLRTRPC